MQRHQRETAKAIRGELAGVHCGGEGAGHAGRFLLQMVRASRRWPLPVAAPLTNNPGFAGAAGKFANRGIQPIDAS